ncbi:hypothetical protein CC86DRAFT_465931 [Ophiobolus disseminans]|uniref:Aerobic respiration control sensor protein arcB n=1 Tax=Ophiobolus disseminans TaxID=1469910 RepID=A0A6A7A4F7_9PLEO|nr:hypothetical protein CC86DRAFT_465931 [Ophiobolus disseminans]
MDLPLVTPPPGSNGGAKGLCGVDMLQFLDHDPRPTFVLDRSANNNSRNNFCSPAYSNPAIGAIDDGRLLKTILGECLTIRAAERRPSPSGFSSWITSQEKPLKSCVHLGYNWTKFMLGSQWIVITGAHVEATDSAKPTDPNGASLSKRTSRTKAPTFDWTDEVPPAKISSHVAWARSIDWAETSLGAMKTWSTQVRSIANLVMQDPRPAVVFCGAELIMVYNETYIELLGGLHPCMGASARVALSGVWSQYFEPIISRNLNGETVEQTDSAIHMVRSGFMEETYFSLKFIPIFDSLGATIAHYEPLTETTREVVSRRQAQTVLQLSEEIPRARNVDSYWALATKTLLHNDKDVPFALLYSVEYDSGDSASSATRMSGEHQECTLRGSVGLPKDSPAGPSHLDLRKNDGFTPYFRRAMDERKPITIVFDEDPSAADLIRGIQWKGFGDPCRAAVVCPLNPTSSKDNILGFMVVGLNPRRPYDDDYHQFILIATRLLSTSLSSILLHEEDIGRRERTIANAEAMKLELKQQLAATQKEVERSALKFQRFAERADIGIFILDMEGVYSFRNDAWYSILSPQDRDLKLGAAWNALIDDDYIDMGQSKFEALVATKQHQSFELRLKRTGRDSASSLADEPMWVICSIFPELTDDGEVVEIIGCVTDISHLKWSEKLKATQASSAQESKRQLENFIDTTSHEMRNPLSAIVQCADSIISTHKAFGSSTDYQKIYQSILDTTIDAAETIVQCSKHMKTIVDDVLTMSKLDSGLFVMTPVDVQLQSIARDAVKMFEGEAKAADIKLEYHVEESCKHTNIQSVSLDPTRVLQILINLVTNAIKFTRLEETRHISVSLGISFEQPVHYADGQLPFLRSSEATDAESLRLDWEKGQIVYIIFAVRDTGRGLSDAERDLLFARFSQASPRTHIDYGGSGLGLFISRRLTEMHGGAIGFSSQAGVGSTFAFYIKSRKSMLTRRQSELSSAAVDLSIRAHVSALSNRARDSKDASPVRIISNEVAAADIHVLIVEDNLVNQRVLAKQLKNIGMKVSVANHGGEALDHLRTTNYCIKDGAHVNQLSLILMDWEMPVMDGLTCVRRIRELQKEGAVFGHVPVIAVTANVRSEQVEIALKAGMDNVISKPFRIPELYACIQKTLDALAQR